MKTPPPVPMENGLRRAGSADQEALVALQEAAYRPNAVILGAEPLPLRADYHRILREYEVWVVPQADGLAGALILEPNADHLLIWSIAVGPTAQGQGIGRLLLAFAEERARAHGTPVLRLYTGERLRHNIAWYERSGFAVERVEVLSDRRLVHMIKILDSSE